MSAAGRYYRVGPKFWTDKAHWDDDAKLLGLYVLTCEHRTTEGLFRMPLEYAAADLRWPMRRFRQAFAQLTSDGFVQYDDDAGMCLIVAAMKWQSPDNPNQVKSAVRAVEGLPRTRLFPLFLGLAERYAQRFAVALRERFPEAFAEPLPEPLRQGLPHPPSPPPPHLTVGSTSEVDALPFAVIDGDPASVETDPSDLTLIERATIADLRRAG